MFCIVLVPLHVSMLFSRDSLFFTYCTTQFCQ